MRLMKPIVLITLSIWQAACVVNEPKNAWRPAVLVQPSVETTAVLNATVSRALNGTKVSLARDVLTTNSELEVERMTQDPVLMQGLNGRLMQAPVVYRFTLKKSEGGDCYLVYQKTADAYRLDGVACRLPS